MATITFFNSGGRAIAYVADDNETIYLFDGTPVGYITDSSVYSYAGMFLGWYEAGWVVDRKGERVFFTDAASMDPYRATPVRPLRQLRPMAALRALRPLKIIRQLRPTKPVPLPVWSAQSSEAFFDCAASAFKQA